MTESETDTYIAGKIRANREVLGLSQVQLGERLELSQQQVQKIERGKAKVSAARLFEIAKIFDKPIAEFYPR